nr:MAG TPA: hypothetical protein [Caudoviricetes sp.]
MANCTQGAIAAYLFFYWSAVGLVYPKSEIVQNRQKNFRKFHTKMEKC